MKKTIRLIMTVLSVTVFVASCQKPEFEEQVRLPKVDLEISALAETSQSSETSKPQNAPATKMSLGENLKPQWHTTDEVAVYDGTDINKFVIKEATGSYATFNGQVTEGSDEFLALYPFKEGLTYSASNGFSTSVKAEQIIAKGDSVDTGALMAMAHAVRDVEGVVQFAFKNVCGLIEVTIPESGKISSVVISSNGEEKFAGEGTVKLDNSGLPVFTPGADAVGSVTLLPEGETFDKGNYYAVVAPVKFETGFSISLVRTDGAAGVKSTDKVMEVVRNGGTNLKDVVAISDWSIKIYTKEQLFAWAANYGKKDHVTLMADIDMNNEPWTPIGTNDNSFNGTFDGNGKKIYNLNVNTNGYAGFLGHVAGSGVVKDLTVGSSDGVSYDNNSTILHTPSKNESNWSYVGAIAKVSGSAYVENVVNFAKLEIPESEYKVKACIGGIVGFSDSKGNIVDCVNNGAINYLAELGAVENNLIGGIVSKCDNPVTVSGCVNKGKITNKNKGVAYIGGIVANSRSNRYDNAKPTLISNCKNTGAIEVTAMTYASNTEVECAVSGVCGILQNANLTGCTNEGKITISTGVSTNHYVGGIAGIRRSTYDTSITDCVNGTKGMTSSLFEFTTTSGDVKFGGILGHCHNSSGVLNITRCTNHSPITLSNGCAIPQVGGISGAIVESVVLTMDNCHNTGNMTFSSVTTTGEKGLGGLIGFLRYNVTDATAVHTVMNSSNSGNITTSASSGGETRMAGIIGYANKNILIENCTNSGAISTTGAATKPRVAGITGVAHTSVNIKGCTNSGAITNASSNQTPYIGGISGYGNTATIKDCINQGEVKLTNTGGAPAVGGVLGQDAGSMTIEGCRNTGNVTATKSTGTLWIGGISAVSTTTSELTSCVNEGTVKASQNGQHSYVGGIVGQGHGIITSCENATKGVVIVEHTSANGKYALAGGIVGKSNSTVTIQNCTNNGTVKALVNTTNKLTGAGGIIGQPQQKVTLMNNTNRGYVYAENKHTSTARVYAGGIWATDVEGTTNAGAASVTGNVNYGEVRLVATKAAASNDAYTSRSAAAAGGLFGFIGRTPVASVAADNINYGVVSATNAGAATTAGALAGTSQLATWSGKVGKNVTVNGVAISTPIDAAWLCPSAEAALTATAVDAPAN